MGVKKHLSSQNSEVLKDFAVKLFWCKTQVKKSLT